MQQALIAQVILVLDSKYLSALRNRVTGQLPSDIRAVFLYLFRVYGKIKPEFLPKKKNEVENFVGAWFSFPKGKKVEAEENIRKLLAHRKSTQPLSWPSAGSTFKNPDNNHAAKLIEDCGLKGFMIGDAKTIKSTIIFGDREQNFDLLVHSTHYSRNLKKCPKNIK